MLTQPSDLAHIPTLVSFVAFSSTHKGPTQKNPVQQLQLVHRNRKVRIAMWNIRGLETIRIRKLQDSAVKEIITNHDIFCFVESHTDSDSVINMEGYTTIHNPRPKSRHKGKMYGGVVALVHNTLLDGVKEIKPRGEGCVWLELQAAYFHLETNVLIGFLYVEPGITKKADPIKHIRAGLENWDPTNPLILMGDINARIGDHISSSTTHSFEHVECIPLEEKRPAPTCLEKC